MKEVVELIETLKEQEVELWVDEGKLCYSAPSGVLEGETLDRVIALKGQLVDFLQRSTISTAANTSLIKPNERETPLLASFAQEQLWIMNQLEDSSATYNMFYGVRLLGTLDTALMASSLNEVVARHEALRTTLVKSSTALATPEQNIAQEIEIPLAFEEVVDLPENERESKALELANEWVCLPFDLETGPLLRVKIIRLQKNEHILALSMHHVVGDGWSMGIFWEEWSEIYNAELEKRKSSLSQPAL